MSQLKNLLILSFAWAIIAFLYSRSSRRKEKQTSDKVNKFILQLNAGEINSGNYGLAADAPSRFNKSDIPFLLEHIDEIKDIPFFPSHPLSIYVPERYFMGETVMWMIESARIDKLYPTLNGKLYNTETNSFPEFYEFGAVADIYRSWWEKAKSDETVYKTNPLTGSPFIWYPEE